MRKDGPTSVSDPLATFTAIGRSAAHPPHIPDISEEALTTSNPSPISTTSTTSPKRNSQEMSPFSWPLLWDACKRSSLPDVFGILESMEQKQIKSSNPGQWLPFLRFVVDCNYQSIHQRQADLIQNRLLTISEKYLPREGMIIGVDQQQFMQHLMEALVHADLCTKALQIFQVWTAEGGKRLKLEGTVMQLRKLKEWTILAAITDDDPKLLRYHGSNVVEARMMALAEIGQPAMAIQTSLNASLPASNPSRDRLTLLFRCHLANNDVVAADKVLEQLTERGENNGVNFILAMLNGYRSLGIDPQVEQCVLDDIGSGKLRYTASVINSLLQLRVDANDYKSASSLLGYLDLPEQWKYATQLPAFPNIRKPKGDIATFTILINMACRYRKLQLSELEVLWKMLLATTSVQRPLDALALRALVRGLIACGHPDEAMTVVSDATYDKPNRWQVGRVKLTAAVFNSLFRHWVAEKGVDGALMVLAMMDQANVLPDAITVRILAVSLGGRAKASALSMAKFSGRLHDALPMIIPDRQLLDAVFHQAVDAEVGRSAPRDEVNAIEVELPWLSSISASADNPTDVDAEGRQIFDPTAGLQPSGPLRTAMAPILEAFAQNGTMSSSSAFTSRLALDRWSHPGDDIPAESIYDIMLKRGIKPTAVHFLQLMQVFVRKHMPQKAEDIFTVAAKVGVVPTVEMWSVLVWGYGETGDVNECHSAVRRMRALGLRPNQYVYSSIGSALLKTRQYAKAHQFMQSSLAKLKEIDCTTLSIAFHASMRAGNFADGIDLLRHYNHVPIDKKLRDSIKKTLHTHRNRIKTRWSEDTRWVADELDDILATAKKGALKTERMSDYVEPLCKALRKLVEPRFRRSSGDSEDVSSSEEQGKS